MLTMIAMLPMLCAQAPQDLHEGWRFRADPESVGEARGWADADFDDSAWAPIEVGWRWEDQGYAELDGHAWYRIRVKHKNNCSRRYIRNRHDRNQLTGNC